MLRRRRKKKAKVRFICKECGKQPEPNKEKSNENWSVIYNKPCVFCGGQLTLDLKNL